MRTKREKSNDERQLTPNRILVFPVIFWWDRHRCATAPSAYVSAKAGVTSLPFYWRCCANQTLIRFLHRLRESAFHISPSDFVRAGNRGHYHSSWENGGHTTTVGSEIEEGRADLRDGGLLVSNVLIEHCSRLHQICRVRANRSKLSWF